MRSLSIAGISTIIALGAVLLAGNALAQQKQQVSFKVSAEHSKYTQQTMIDVGDLPGHQVRVFEIHRLYPTNAPVFEGMKLAESWSRGATDLIDGNGLSTIYSVFVVESGDKVFVRAATVAQSAGPGKFTTTSSGTITGGTGKFAGIKGLMRSVGSAKPKAGISETQYAFEYWIEK
jgi:hypothetical protein